MYDGERRCTKISAIAEGPRDAWLWPRDCFTILPFAVMQSVARVCQRQLSYLFNFGARYPSFSKPGVVITLIFILTRARFILQLQQSGILALLLFVRLKP